MTERYGFGLVNLKTEGSIYFSDGTSLAPGDEGYDEACRIVEDERLQDHIAFSTGNGFYANNMIVGIDPEGNVSEGYDGGVDTNALSDQERIELADMMIKRWTEFKLRRAENGK